MKNNVDLLSLLSTLNPRNTYSSESISGVILLPTTRGKHCAVLLVVATQITPSGDSAHYRGVIVFNLI